VNSSTLVSGFNADKLDGLHATDFVQGTGRIMRGRTNMSPFTSNALLFLPGFFRFEYNCPEDLTEPGVLAITNVSTQELDMFIDHGGATPEYTLIPSGATSERPAAAAGDRIQIQLAGAFVGVADISLFSVHRASDCHVQGIASVAT
jgi:hypothetical protein